LVLALLVVAACAGGSGPDAADQRPGLVAPTTEAPPDVHRLVVAVGAAKGGDGSSERPFSTLRAGFEALRPGDQLVVGAGTYDEELVDLQIRAGTEAAPIDVVAAPGARPVLQGLLWLEGADWWRIRGLNVTWADRSRKDQHMVKLTGGAHWVFADAEVWGARSFAAILVAGDPVDFALRDLYVHDTRPSNGDSQDHLIYLNAGTGGGTVEGCLLVNSPNGRAIKVGPASKDGSPVGNIVIRGNTMVRNLGPSSIQLAWRTSNVVMERNVMVETRPGRAAITGFHLDGSGNVARDNVAFAAASVVQPGVGIVDGGANRMVDPGLDDRFLVTAPGLAGYGSMVGARLVPG
jgi:hypothetical protein